LDRWSDIFFVETFFPFSKESCHISLHPPLYLARHLQKYTVSNLDELVKSLLNRHPGESRGPELMEINGFRFCRNDEIYWNSTFLRDHQSFFQKGTGGTL